MAKRRKKQQTLSWQQLLIVLVLALLSLAYTYFFGPLQAGATVNLDSIPAYSGQAYVAVNGNRPFFTEPQYTETSYETYSPLDPLGRCGPAEANVGQNLITGTRYLNVTGMLPFENMVADYVKETNNHVLYRVTPLFDGEDLVAKGVLMEAWSVEDGGEGVCFNVYCYNVQPGVTIDYATGDNWETK